MEQLSEKAEEILESLWVMTVEGDNVGCLMESLGIVPEAEELLELIQRAYVEVRDDRVHLRKEGRAEARMSVRRHRLAERLTMDILGIEGEEGNEQACVFEHLLRQGSIPSSALCSIIQPPVRMAIRFLPGTVASRHVNKGSLGSCL